MGSTEELVPVGPVFLNAFVAFFLTVFMTHLAWFDVVKKRGCCCFILCCCLGIPNLLATAVLALVFGIVALIQGFEALGSGFFLPILASFSALAHGIALLYLSFESFMVWRLSVSEAAPGPKDIAKQIPASQVVGSAPAATDAPVDYQFVKAMPVILGTGSADGKAVIVERFERRCGKPSSSSKVQQVSATHFLYKQ